MAVADWFGIFACSSLEKVAVKGQEYLERALQSLLHPVQEVSEVGSV